MVHHADCLCKYLNMKTGRDCAGLGGAWAMRWKAWVRCSPNADFVQQTTPGDPMKYVSRDLHMVKDFVGSGELVDDFRQFR